MPEPHSTFYLIGIDAGDLEFIEANLAQLPNLRGLFERQRAKRLDTTAGVLPGSVWPTFYTGSLPGEHGIYHHIQWDPSANKMRRVAEDWLYAEPFWYDAARNGSRVCAFDVPMTFPTRLADGLEIINWGSHDQLGAYHANQKGMQSELRKRFGGHPMGPEIPVNKTAEQLEKIRNALVTGAARKGEVIRHLMTQGPWDLFVAVFGECHRGGHILWRDPDDDDPLLSPEALLDVYIAVDQAVGDVIGQMDLQHDSLVVFSLHGMQSNYSQEHFIPKLMDRINAAFRGEDVTSPSPPAQQSSIMRTLRELVPARLQHAIAHAVPVGVRDWVVSRAVDGGHDWTSTPALALLADLNGYLRFNIDGRESKGSIKQDSPDFTKYDDWLTESLESFETATGDRLVQRVLRAHEEFAGRRVDYLPDRIITWTGADPTHEIRSTTLGTVHGELATGRGGNHRPEGFIWADVRQTSQLPEHIADFAKFTLNALA